VAPALDVGLAVGASAVMNRQIYNPQIELGGTENEIEIPKWIKLAKIAPVSGNFLVILPEQYLGAAESVFDFLTD